MKLKGVTYCKTCKKPISMDLFALMRHPDLKMETSKHPYCCVKCEEV